MKIAMFTDTYYPQLNGVATSVLMLSQHLRAQGHQVYVFTTTDPDAPPLEQDVFRLPSVPFFKDRRMGMFYHPGVARMIGRLGIDIIHTHTEFCLGVFGRVLAREYGLPLIHTMHTIYEDYTHYLTRLHSLQSVARQIARRLTTDFCNAADEVIVPTEKVRDLLLDYQVHRDIVQIPSGIELDRFAPGRYDPAQIQEARREIGADPEEKVLLYLGRIAEEKNIDELLYHLQDYLQASRDKKLIFVGDGADRPRLEGIAYDLGLADKAVFAGAKPWDEIGLYYQAGDVFVNASQSETQGMTYIEAMAAGVPVVAKGDRCLEGVLLEGFNGYTFSDKDSMVEALDKVLADDVERERLRRGALMTAKHFSAEEYALRVSEAYTDLLRKRPPRPQGLYQRVFRRPA